MVETKPFSLQSPEQIAKDYGGNKQKIAEAMRLGIIQTTPGLLAAMFIDQMRAGAQAEQAPQQTVAQQVFAPPAPQMPMGMPPMPQAPAAPAGLGATPEAAAMPPMPGGAPMMAPPPPMEQPMPGMAMGGLAVLPVPDDMFDEPTNGGFDDGYRGGGLVAFREGTDEEGVKARTPSLTNAEIGGDVVGVAPDEITVLGRRPGPPEVVDEPAGPDEYYGTFRDPFRMGERITELAPQSTKRREQFNTYLEKMLDPGEQKKRRQEDMWMALGQIGARMATTPGSLLQAASTGIQEALPGVRAAAKERRGEERAAISELAKNEGLSNADAREMYKLIQAGTDQYGRFNEARLTREQQDKLARFQEERADYRARLAAATGITQTGMTTAASRDVAAIGAAAEERRFNLQVNQAINEMIRPGGSQYAAYIASPNKNQFIADLRTAFGAGANDPLGMRP